MRLAVLLLLAVPAYAAAQPSPPASVLKLPSPLPPPVAIHRATPPPVKPGDHKPTKPDEHKPGASASAPHKPTSEKAAPEKPTPGKPATAKPVPAKPTPSKPARKPAPPAAPKPAAVAPAPAPVEAPPAEPGKGSNTNLPLPRFASLRSDDVNFRSGPGTRYPIDWVYKRRDLPVEIEREFDLWRLVRDPLGNKGWVNQATLTGRRTAIVAGTERVLRQTADDTAGPVAKLKVGVILRLRSCEAGSQWCQAQIGDYRGYIRRSEIWGVTPDEVIQ